MDIDIVKRFICVAKEAYKKVDNHSFNFPITIESAYRLATNIEKLLKEQEAVVRCKDCRFWQNEDEQDMQSSWLPCMEVITRADFFCADGRRTDDSADNELL